MRRIQHAVVVASSMGFMATGATETALGAQGSAVSGTVIDSIGGSVLRGASVQLLGAADSVLGKQFAAVSDSQGRFFMTSVPAGRYLAGFHHPLLDSLGLEIEERVFTVSGTQRRLDLATPSPSTFIALVCPDDRSGLLLVGHVRQTGTEAPMPNASVSATWTELDTTNVFAAQRNRERTMRTTPEGWYALCGLPADVAFLARGVAGADTSGYVRLSTATGAVQVATFHVGGAVRGTAAGEDAGPPVVWRGEAQLSGMVRDDRGQPLANAQLSVWGTTAETATDSRGRFRLGGLPGGTQTVEVRAIGFQPVEQVVTLSGQPVAVEIALRDRATELAGVNVTATAHRARLGRFYERMRDSERGINHGYFITEEDIERRKPAYVTQLFYNFPTVRVRAIGSPMEDDVLGTRECKMTVFVDNVRVVGTLSGKDEKINKLLPPSHVAAIEIYPRSVTAPPAYQSLNGTCGVILIWTK